MARIKFGALVTSGSGSVGGHTIQNSKGGMQLRTKPSYKGRPSFAQSLIRSYNSKLQEGWRLLTDTQRKEWDVFAFSHSISNQKGTDHFISGHSLWLKFQFPYISNGFAFQPSPYIARYGPLSSELVDQIAWCAVGLPFWDLVQGSWYGDGSSLISPDSSALLRHRSFWSVGSTYRVVVSVVQSAGRLYLPYDGVNSVKSSFSSGTYSYDYTPAADDKLYFYSLGFLGSVTALSIKLHL